VTHRMAPLEPPFEASVGEQLRSMMPSGVEPIALFRTFVHNLPMAQAMGGWGRYELSPALSLDLRSREIVIDRTCARRGCEYEWGVHVAFFALKAALDPAQVTSLTHGDSEDACWSSRRDRLLIRAVDALQDDGDIDDQLWGELSGEFTPAQVLDLTMLCGWYVAISFTARTARVPLEAGAPTFASVRSA
jgi:alkylhydroperoxidase family enzyme